MSKLFKKPTNSIDKKVVDKGFNIFGLTENPFPSTPFVNQNSPEKKYNGTIYDDSIREKEYLKLLRNFIQIPQSDLDHLRLGFIAENSFLGRGNGKSSFLLHVLKNLNEEYCLNLSNNQNKCFSVYVVPEGSGKVKSFDKFLDGIVSSIFNSGIINESLAILRYEAIERLNAWKEGEAPIIPDNIDEFVNLFNNKDWLNKNTNIYTNELTREILKVEWLSSVSGDFPLTQNLKSTNHLVTNSDFIDHYKSLRKEQDKLNFVFNDLVKFFLSVGFNGSYILIDDFERIPDFQSSNQKKEFATQLRTILFDGGYLNAKIGFFNFIFALHAGVPRIMQEAWGLSGLEQRVPMINSDDQRHAIEFVKLNQDHAVKIISTYLNEFRTADYKGDKLHPFNEDSIKKLAVNSEMNISKILRNANNIIDQAISNGLSEITVDIVNKFIANDKYSDNPDETSFKVKSVEINLEDKLDGDK
ncbi:MAG TPA: hypothetical protein VKZ80_05045 [Flavobacterium sp.]|nr:hypothetical protein [Flavobacterium sp.]